MVSPLEGSLAAQIYTGMKSLFIDATLTRDTTSSNSPDIDRFNPPPPTSTDYPCKVVVETYAEKYRMDGLVKANDRRVLILGNSVAVVPTINDRVSVRGITFTVIDVQTDPALAVYTCQGRF